MKMAMDVLLLREEHLTSACKGPPYNMTEEDARAHFISVRDNPNIVTSIDSNDEETIEYSLKMPKKVRGHIGIRAKLGIATNRDLVGESDLAAVQKVLMNSVRGGMDNSAFTSAGPKDADPKDEE